MPPKLMVGLAQEQSWAREHLEVFGEVLRVGYGQLLMITTPEKFAEAHMLVHYADDLAPEAYRLRLGTTLKIEVGGPKGLAHATATLLQLWCPIGSRLPALQVEDAPANPYRSLMVDLGRNPHSLMVMKETIDLLWFYKVESLHLHLTDDQRFAFPSTAFPKLTSADAWTLEEFHELEDYAVRRGVTLIPELESPGHGTLLRQHYPEVFGASPTELASLPSARAGLKTILVEMMEVFQSSPYVHVGGDEAYGVPHHLQQDLVNDLHAFLSEHGRTAMVWEGPPLGEGEHKIDTDVVHFNWRTIDFPADAMLAAGYPVVQASWDPLYMVDHYPRNNFTMASPAHIYRTLTRTRYAHFNPGMPTFANPIVVEPHPQILGYCMPWWEGREPYLLPLITSRLIAMAAVAWAEPTHRDVDAFLQASKAAEAQRRLLFYPVRIQTPTPQSAHHLVFAGAIELACSMHIADVFSSAQAYVRYTLDGSEPTPSDPYLDGPIAIDQSCTFRAALFLGGKQVGHGSRWLLQQVTPEANLALGKPVTTSVAGGPFFSASRLTDGGTGNLDYFLGYPAMPDPIHIVVDLEKQETVEHIKVFTYQAGDSYESFEVDLSADGAQWTTIGTRREAPEGASTPVTFSCTPQAARYVRIRSFGHKGQVFDSFSRITEIQVR